MQHTSMLAACMYGLAVGDALGVPYEFRLRDTFRVDGYLAYGTHNQPAGTWSDDTALSLASLHSLIANHGEVDVEDMRHRFADWLTAGLYTPDGQVFDCGLATSKALHTGRGCSGENSQGNGSLMRVAPLAFSDADDDTIGRVSAITHAHPTCMQACMLQVRLLRRLLDGEPIRTAISREGLGPIWRMPRREIRSDGFVSSTQTAVLWCAANTTDYYECVRLAVELGDDTDTTACVAGAMAGIMTGLEGIPIGLRDGLRGHALLDLLVQTAATGCASQSQP